MSDWIRDAVRYAEGWSAESGLAGHTPPMPFEPNDTTTIRFEFDDCPQLILDALAAQLTKQVDEMNDLMVYVYPERAEVVREGMETATSVVAFWTGPDRTENTIRVCVEFYRSRDDRNIDPG